MWVVDEEPWSWFLFEDSGRLYLDVLIEKGAISYGATAELTDGQAAEYAAGGHSWMNSLAGTVHGKAYDLQWTAPALPADFHERTLDALREWRARKRILKRFNVYNKSIAFDPATGDAHEIQRVEDAAVEGIGDVVADTCVALVQNGTRQHLYVGKACFEPEYGALKLNYVHQSNGTTVFSAADRTKQVQLTYPSWWLQSPPWPVAFGSPADEDEDFCGYVITALKAPDRAALLASLTGRARIHGVKYYAYSPGASTSLPGVFRFYENRARVPERYATVQGWVGDATLWRHFGSGALAECDVISPAEACNIIVELEKAR
ncbi:hypothetical protein [Massilia sp. TWP1-3-3]|uniref:hypothetical protein n=1 Tax=Massilia sp. TWP1-3-3 TaxID=2804573 RepID=UPI003CEFF9D0